MPDAKYDILPGERVAATSGGRLATVIGVALLVVLAANFAAAEFLRRIPVNGGYALAKGKWELMDRAIAEKRKLDLLIVGDSSSNQGLNPAVIAKMTKERAMNFGVVAEALPIEPAWAVRHYFESTPKKNRPKTVLWMHVYDIWSRPDPGNRRLLAISSALPPTAWPQIEKGPKVRFTIDEIRWRRLTPLWSQSTSMQLLLRRPLDSIAVSNRFKFDELGFTAEREPDPKLVARDTKQHLALARDAKRDLGPNRTARDSMDAMARMADRYGFDLWVVESPINESLWRDAAFRQRWGEVHAELKKFADASPRVHLVFDEPERFADARMQNCDHVLADAADEFTAAVMRRIQAARARVATAPATIPSP